MLNRHERRALKRKLGYSDAELRAYNDHVEKRAAQGVSIGSADSHDRIARHRAIGAEFGAETFTAAAGALKATADAEGLRFLNDLPTVLDVMADHARAITVRGYELTSSEGSSMIEAAVFDVCAKGQFLTSVFDFVDGTIGDWEADANGEGADVFAELRGHLDEALPAWIFPDEDRLAAALDAERKKAADRFYKAAALAGVVVVELGEAA